MRDSINMHRMEVGFQSLLRHNRELVCDESGQCLEGDHMIAMT